MPSFTNTIVDKVYVINLDKDKDRLERIDTQLRRYGIAYERFPAILGSTVGSSHPAFSGFCNSFCTDSMKGCALSHTSIWKEMVEKNYKAVLILEDDAILTDDFDARLKAAWYQVPDDYDVLYLGCGLKCGDDDGALVPKLVNKVLGHTPEAIDERVLSVNGSVGFYGYVLRNGAAARTLAAAPIHTHIDLQMQIWTSQYGMAAYSVKPLLIHTRDEGNGSNLSEAFPIGLNSVLKLIPITPTINASWALSENSLKLGPFNVNLIMFALFLAVCFIPVGWFKWIAAWVVAEGAIAADFGNMVKYLAFLSMPIAARFLWACRGASCKRLRV